MLLHVGSGVSAFLNGIPDLDKPPAHPGRSKQDCDS